MTSKKLVSEVHRTMTAQLRDAAIDLWCAGNDAGGAVGFIAGASRESVAASFDAYLPGIESGTTVLMTAQPAVDTQDSGQTNDESQVSSSPSSRSRLAAMAFVVQPPRDPGRPNFSVVVTIERLVLEPSLWGGGLGAEFMHDVHSVCAELPGAVHTQVMYRSHLGLERFYERLGYTQVGWLPDCMTIPTNDGGVEWRSAGYAMRRLDGQPYTDLP